MRPTSRELIDGIIRSLDERVLPVVDDRWAASTLRSIRCLLLHLAERVESEEGILEEENADLLATLAKIHPLLGESESTRALREAIRDRGSERREPSRRPTIAELAAENEALKRLLDEALEVAGRLPPEVRSPLLAEADGCIERCVQRELPLFQSAFAGPLF